MKYTCLAYWKLTSKVPSPEVEFSFSVTGKSSLPFDPILPHWTSPGSEELDSSWSFAKNLCGFKGKSPSLLEASGSFLVFLALKTDFDFQNCKCNHAKEMSGKVPIRFRMWRNLSSGWPLYLRDVVAHKCLVAFQEKGQFFWWQVVWSSTQFLQ